ncbi:MAG: FHA domain-containing protein [Chloroflexota bacterium]
MGGSCSTCGRPLPEADLEAVAAGIDHTLSVEAGKEVPRTAWAGRPPDGVMDSLLSFMPSVKSKRQLWERGQALWTERMTQALSGPCDSCRGMAIPPPGSTPPGPTMAQPASQPYDHPGSYPQAGQYAQPGQPGMEPAGSPAPYAGATSMMPPYGAPGQGESGPPPVSPWDSGEGATQMVTSTPADPGVPDDEPSTTAVPAFLTRPAASSGPAPAAAQPPAPPPPPVEADEHESHTVMLSVPANLRSGPRLIVLDGPVHGRQFTLGRQLTTIGRSIGCHVTIDADAVGYDHARVVRADDGWRIETVGGSGDTFVNDDPVREARPLASGDVIRIGPARMRFESAG